MQLVFADTRKSISWEQLNRCQLLSFFRMTLIGIMLLCSQNGGADPHRHIIIRNCLCKTFSNSWTGRDAPLAWALRFPDFFY